MTAVPDPASRSTSLTDREGDRSTALTQRAVGSTSASPGTALPPFSRPLFIFMAWQLGAFMRRHLNALRLANWGQPQVVSGVPLVIYSNHPSWWDAALFIVMAQRLLPERTSFAPIDAEMLRKYRFFGRIGAFGVDLHGPRGGIAFLRTATAILGDAKAALWVTAQGTFADPRERPLRLRPGIAHLPERARGIAFLPLAIEYTFWSERGPEALIAFGAPIDGDALAALPRAARMAQLEQALGTAMDRLAGDAQRRDPADFTTMALGRQGIGGFYDMWRRLRANWAGQRFDQGHLERRR